MTFGTGDTCEYHLFDYEKIRLSTITNYSFSDLTTASTASMFLAILMMFAAREEFLFVLCLKAAHIKKTRTVIVFFVPQEFDIKEMDSGRMQGLALPLAVVSESQVPSASCLLGKPVKHYPAD